MDGIAERLRESLIGQDQAIEAIASCLEVHAAGLSLPNKPIGIFLLVGPTGSGKTLTVEALAEVLHGDRKKFLRIDGGE